MISLAKYRPKELHIHTSFLFLLHSCKVLSAANTEKGREILQGQLCLRILAALPCQLLSQPFFPPQGCEIILRKGCVLIPMVVLEERLRALQTKQDPFSGDHCSELYTPLCSIQSRKKCLFEV